MHRWLTGIFVLGLFQPIAAAPLEFAIAKQMQQTVDTTTLLQQIQRSTLAAHDPPHPGTVHYEGIALRAVLDHIYGADWRHYDTVAFSSRDGYTPSVPVATIEHVDGLIALSEAGRADFSPIRQTNGDLIDPGPAYLVWDNTKKLDPTDRVWLAWPWQLTRIALFRYQDLYPHSMPAAESSVDVKRGATVFQQHCIRCHTLNGEGGTIGPELNTPESVTERFQNAWLERWILDPRSVRPSTVMPPLPMHSAEDRGQLSDLLSYLNYMARHKTSKP